MTKEGTCVICGLAPREPSRPNGCAGECEELELEVPVEETTEEEEVEEEVVEEEESDNDDEDLEAFLEELPVKELKKLCEEADLSKKGKKADLVARLLE